MFIHFRSSIKDLKRNMLYEIDEQLDQCSDSAMHNSTLTKVGVRKNQREHNISSEVAVSDMCSKSQR